MKGISVMLLIFSALSHTPITHTTLTCSDSLIGAQLTVFSPQGAAAMWPICFCSQDEQVSRSRPPVLHLTGVLEYIRAQRCGSNEAAFVLHKTKVCEILFIFTAQK